MDIWFWLFVGSFTLTLVSAAWALVIYEDLKDARGAFERTREAKRKENEELCDRLHKSRVQLIHFRNLTDHLQPALGTLRTFYDEKNRGLMHSTERKREMQALEADFLAALHPSNPLWKEVLNNEARN